MAVWKLSEADYDKLKGSARHHFLHLNVTSVCPDQSVNMTFSMPVATMLRQELEINAVLIAPINHPDEAYILDDADLHRTALNAPGFNGEPQPE